MTATSSEKLEAPIVTSAKPIDEVPGVIAADLRTQLRARIESVGQP